MSSVTVDLTNVVVDGLKEAESILNSSVLPALASDLRSSWPKDTGYSAANWKALPNAIENSVSYTGYIETASGLAVDTVLPSVVSRVVSKEWR